MLLSHVLRDIRRGYRRPTRSRRLVSLAMLVPAVLLLLSAPLGAESAAAAGPTSVFSDALGYGWRNWSWGGSINFAATSPVYSGSRAIAFTSTGGWAAINLHTDLGVDTAPYTHLSFAIRTSQTGQRLGVALYDSNHSRILPPLDLSSVGGDPTPGTWKLYNVPLSSLGGTSRTIKGVSFQDLTGKTQPAVYADQIQLVSAPVTAGGSTAPTPTPAPSTCGTIPAYEEVRPGNTTQNMTAGRPADASRSPYPMPTGFSSYFAKINGQGCVGTTEQILEWAAKKWGFDQLGYTDLAKAMAVKETWWIGTVAGDTSKSWGILQVKDGSTGYWPDGKYSSTSTAYGADYAMAIIRFHYDGNSWLGAGTRGNLRNAVGAYFCGCGYAGSSDYTNKVFEYFNAKPWKSPGLPPYNF